jgi:hypothetical protein
MILQGHRSLQELCELLLVWLQMCQQNWQSVEKDYCLSSGQLRK